jgi:RNA polymerase sigma-70 factor (ECF subfamily)
VNEVQEIQQAREGDELALRSLYDRHVDRVFRLAYRMAGDEDAAREYTQDAFVRAFQRLDQFEGRAAFSTWLHSITVSVCMNGLRKKKRMREREWGLEDVSDPGRMDPAATPHLKRRLHAAIDALPELYRTVFLLYDVEGYRHEEIAEMLDVAVGTSKARLSRARAQLRAALGDLAGEYA